MDEKRCENCIHWQIANACPASQRLKIRYDDNWEDIRPPHADLNWSVCDAAVPGFENDSVETEAVLFGGKMAVFDGSEYIAELWTRFDHVCGEWTVRP
jgi:hypothetical protein